jgi:hypothetical protein
MAEKSKKTAVTAKTPSAEKTAAKPAVDVSDVVERAAGLSDEVLKSVEAGQRAAIETVRKFVDTVDEAMPAHGDRPSRRETVRETVIDAALDMADRLVTTQYNFIRSVVGSADRALRKPDEKGQ